MAALDHSEVLADFHGSDLCTLGTLCRVEVCRRGAHRAQLGQPRRRILLLLILLYYLLSLRNDAVESPSGFGSSLTHIRIHDADLLDEKA